jgi:TonB family protein
MSEMIYIQDDFGNQIPMLDAYGNFSVHVLMLYAEDKLSEADRKTVNSYAVMDEMAKDALEGYAHTSNPSKTRFHLGQLNADIQKRSGAAAVIAIPKEKSDFDYRKLAAAVALLVVIGGATFFGAQYFSKEELADNTTLETVSEEDSSAETESESVIEQPVEELETRLESESAELSDSEDRNLETEPVVEALSKAADTRNADKAGQAELVAAKAKEKQAEKPKTPPTAKASDKEAALADAVTGNANAKKDAKGGAVTSTVATNQPAQAMREEAAGASQDADEIAMTAAQNRLAAEQSSKSSVENERQAQKPATSDRSSSATYPGGDISMYKFIEKKKIYSDVMLAQNLTGSITVSFDIEPDGRVSNAQIKSGVNGLLNEDALRVVRSMPKWKPAQDATGQSVKSSKTVVIKYGY